jgi:hypothetical protein
LLRITVAVPVRVATLPIGSVAGACADAGDAGEGAGDGDAAGRTGCGAGEGEGAGEGWACAILAAAEIAGIAAGKNPSSTAELGV